jgi:hypothetical protein
MPRHRHVRPPSPLPARAYAAAASILPWVPAHTLRAALDAADVHIRAEERAGLAGLLAALVGLMPWRWATEQLDPGQRELLADVLDARGGRRVERWWPDA